MSIIEEYKDEIIEVIKEKIESGSFSNIPTVCSFIHNLPDIEEQLLRQYISKVAPSREDEPIQEVLYELGVAKDVALFQATLNDTILIGEDHELYTNCATDLLKTQSKYRVREDLYLEANRKGYCRGYKMTKTKTANMAKGVGLVRTQNRFDKSCFWIYPCIRVYIEYILKYAQEYGVVLKTQDKTEQFTLCDIINKRFGLGIKTWDTLHEPLYSFDGIFDINQILSTTNNGYIGVPDKDGTTKRIDMLKNWEITPVVLEEVFPYYGAGKEELTKEILFKVCVTKDDGLRKYYQEDSTIYKRDIANHMKKNEMYKSLSKTYTKSHEIPIEDLAKKLETGTVAISVYGEGIDLYTTKDMKSIMREKAKGMLNDPCIQTAIASEQTGGYDLVNLFPFLRSDLFEVESITLKEDKQGLIAESTIKGCWYMW